jgi:hypothetical protein
MESGIDRKEAHRLAPQQFQNIPTRLREKIVPVVSAREEATFVKTSETTDAIGVCRERFYASSIPPVLDGLVGRTCEIATHTGCR